MKKILSAAMILLLLSACTVQKAVDPIIFVDRLEENEAFIADKETMHFDGNVCALFLDYKSELRIATEMTVTENGTVSSIALSAKSLNNDLFLEAVEEIVKIFAPDEDFAINESFFTDRYTYNETASYLYSGYKDNETVFFSVTNKNLAPTETPELTLRAETTAKN